MKTFRVLSVGLIVAFAVYTSLAGCRTQEEAADDPNARSSAPCSEGPQYTWQSTFSQDDAPAGYDVNHHNPPTCTNHCGTEYHAPPYVGAYPYEALPSGSCASAGELCSMRAKPMCPCLNDVGYPSSTGGYDTFYCRCDAGQWRCTKIKNSEIGAIGCQVQPLSPSCTHRPEETDAATDG